MRSPSDAPDETREKMGNYLSNGVRLGWLIDPQSETVEVYRPGREVETQRRPNEVPGEEVLPGFVLALSGTLTGEA